MLMMRSLSDVHRRCSTIININNVKKVISTLIASRYSPGSFKTSTSQECFHDCLQLRISSNTLSANIDARRYTTQKRKIRLNKELLQNEILYGRSVCIITLKASRRAIFSLYLLKIWETTQPTDKRVIETIELAENRGIRIRYLKRSELDILSSKRPHQGICLEVGELPYLNMDVNDLKDADDESRIAPLWIMLTDILDPMNIGAILRSCLYFGVDRVIVHGNCAPMTPVVSKASSGAVEILPVYSVDNAQMTIHKLLEKDWDILGTVTYHNSIIKDQETPVDEISKASCLKPTLVMFGSEGTGLSEDLLKLCTRLITIPSPDDNLLNHLRSLVGSLNVSTAAAITLYELQKTRIKE